MSTPSARDSFDSGDSSSRVASSAEVSLELAPAGTAAEKKPPAKDEKLVAKLDKLAAPVQWHTPNALEALAFSHVSPLISRGHVRRLEPDDLCRLPEMESAALAEAFDRDWAAEREKHPDNPSLVRACLVGSRPVFLFTAVLYAIAQGTLFSGPILLRRIVEAIECRAAGKDNCASTQDMYYYAMIMTVFGVVQNLCQAQSDFHLQRLGVRVRNRLMCCLLYTSDAADE